MNAGWAGPALVGVASLPMTAAENGIVAPTVEAVALAGRAVRALAAHAELPKPHIVPSADGGAGVTFRRGGRIAFLEVHNEGPVAVLALYDGAGWPESAEVEDTEAGLAAAAAKAAAYMAGAA